MKIYSTDQQRPTYTRASIKFSKIYSYVIHVGILLLLSFYSTAAFNLTNIISIYDLENPALKFIAIWINVTSADTNAAAQLSPCMQQMLHKHSTH